MHVHGTSLKVELKISKNKLKEKLLNDKISSYITIGYTNNTIECLIFGVYILQPSI